MSSVCTILLDISIPGTRSLKEKRSVIKPITHKLRHQFNISIAEVEYQDVWDRSIILCAIVSNSSRYSQEQAAKLIDFFEDSFRSVYLLSHKVEFI